MQRVACISSSAGNTVRSSSAGTAHPGLPGPVWLRRGSRRTQPFTKQDLLDDRQIRGELVAFPVGQRQIGEPRRASVFL
ncbi:hypothetical protein PQR31_31405 [Paraburkholderia dipogonis]